MKGQIKAIIYPVALGFPDLSVTDVIVYSQVLYRSLSGGGGDAFDKEGKLDVGKYADFGWRVPIAESAAWAFYGEIGVSRSRYYESLVRLRERGYMDGESVLIVGGVCDRYFALHPRDGLSGYGLVVYSYIVEMTRRYGEVDRYHVDIAEELGLSVAGLSRCLKRLGAMGLVRFDRRGHQLVLTA